MRGVVLAIAADFSKGGRNLSFAVELKNHLEYVIKRGSSFPAIVYQRGLHVKVVLLEMVQD